MCECDFAILHATPIESANRDGGRDEVIRRCGPVDEMERLRSVEYILRSRGERMVLDEDEIGGRARKPRGTVIQGSDAFALLVSGLAANRRKQFLP